MDSKKSVKTFHDVNDLNPAERLARCEAQQDRQKKLFGGLSKKTPDKCLHDTCPECKGSGKKQGGFRVYI